MHSMHMMSAGCGICMCMGVHCHYKLITTHKHKLYTLDAVCI